MPTYLMFGTLTQAAMKAVRAKRTEDAMAFTKKPGGDFKMGCALLSEVDSVLTLGLHDTERAIQVWVGLSRLLDINFRTAPAANIDEFDQLAAA